VPTSQRTRCRNLAVFAALLAAAGPLAACRRNVADKASQDEAKESLEKLKGQVAELKAKFSALRKQYDAVPLDVPGFSEARGKFYAIEEGRGITDLKVTLLSNRLDAALASGKRDELQQVSKDITQTFDEVHQIDELHVKLLHQVMAFERMARQMKEPGADKPAVADKQAAAEPIAKTKRSKSKP
jgi:hypothetical protein